MCGDTDIFTPFSEPEAGHTPRNYTGKFQIQKDFHIKWQFLKEKKRIDSIWPIRELLSQYSRGILYYHHIPAWQVRNRLTQDVWDNYYKFCVERNPFDKVLSAWWWYNHKMGATLTLDEYLDVFERWTFSRDHAIGMWPYNYLNYVNPENKKVMVDKIIPYERLNEDLKKVFKFLNLKADFAMFPRAKGGVRNGSGYREILNSAQRNRVFTLLKDEFELHGYEY